MDSKVLKYLFSLLVIYYSSYAQAATHVVEYEQVLHGSLADGYVSCSFTQVSTVPTNLGNAQGVDDQLESPLGFPAYAIGGDTYTFQMKSGSTDYSANGAISPSDVAVDAELESISVSCGVNLGGSCVGNQCPPDITVPVVSSAVKNFYGLVAPEDTGTQCYLAIETLGDFADANAYFASHYPSLGLAIIEGVPYNYQLRTDSTFAGNCGLVYTTWLILNNVTGSEGKIEYTRQLDSTGGFGRWPVGGVPDQNYNLPYLKSNLDADCDGTMNIHDPHPLDDDDSGLPNIDDANCDGDQDGYVNDLDSFPYNPEEWQDSDSDTLGDNHDPYPASQDGDNDKNLDPVDNCPTVSNYVQSDSDNDGIGNACDEDMDNDGVLNVNDQHPLNPNAAGDLDYDGVDLLVDNCPDVSNYVQSDSDGDGIGNACDLDVDGDGVSDVSDSHPLNPLYYSDPDRDLINADLDNCPTISNYVQSDSDGDGIGNACDPDVDGDGVDDVLDNYPLNPNIW